ncbi:MAG TPA: L,D-transpeptidase [Prolixibacteraceae bacterium]|nr:L,D-transpeptidase [Prolixibacteraceae bacterium]
MEIEEENKRSHLNVIMWIIPVLLFCIFVLMILFTPVFQDSAFKVKSWFTGFQVSEETTTEGIEKLEVRAQRNINSIEAKLDNLKPVKPYIVVNTTENRYSLRTADGDTVRTGGCSTGKNEVLIAGKKRIIFKTPKGMFTVLNKQENRPWIKPDWAFIEDGLPIPSARSASRIEYNTLGDYALSIGDGYMLHGTLYQRFLGLPVTHGCVRLGDKDLDVIYHTLSKGSKVFIY